MPGDPHPIDVVIVDGDPVAKSVVRSYVKQHTAVSVADADEIRATDFSGQTGGLQLAAVYYRLDTSDTTSLDDGSNIIIDAAGNRFKKVATGADEVQSTVTVAGDVTLDEDADDVIIIKKTVGAATNVNLPSAGDRIKPIEIVDGKGDAATNNITIIPQSGESIMATVDYSYIIDSNGGSIRLKPLADGSGWFT